MHLSRFAQCLLKLVFTASSGRGSLTRPELERRSGRSRAEVNRALDELARLGLLDAQRLRLTLPGLALAVAFGVRTRVEARPAARRAARSCAWNAPRALFSWREPPRAVA